MKQSLEANLAPIVDSEDLTTIKNLYTPSQLASKLNISIKTIYYYARRNEIPFVRIGKHLRFNFDDVLSYFTLRSQGPQLSCLRPSASLEIVNRSQPSRPAISSLKNRTGNLAPLKKE